MQANPMVLKYIILLLIISLYWSQSVFITRVNVRLVVAPPAADMFGIAPKRTICLPKIYQANGNRHSG